MMFSNGTEYEAFLERNCYQCPMYVPFEEATKDRPVCPIEDRIAQAGFSGDKNDFPYEWLDEDGTMAVYTCRRRLGKKKRFRVVKHQPETEKTCDDCGKRFYLSKEGGYRINAGVTKILCRACLFA